MPEDPKPAHVLWSGPFASSSGYGEEARAMAFALDDAGVPVSTRRAGPGWSWWSLLSARRIVERRPKSGAVCQFMVTRVVVERESASALGQTDLFEQAKHPRPRLLVTQRCVRPRQVRQVHCHHHDRHNSEAHTSLGPGRF